MYKYFVYTCVWAPCSCSLKRPGKGIGALELALETVASLPMRAESQIWVLWKSSTRSWPMSHLSSTRVSWFMNLQSNELSSIWTVSTAHNSQNVKTAPATRRQRTSRLTSSTIKWSHIVHWKRNTEILIWNYISHWDAVPITPGKTSALMYRHPFSQWVVPLLTRKALVLCFCPLSQHSDKQDMGKSMVEEGLF